MIVLIYVKWWYQVNTYDKLCVTTPTEICPSLSISTSPSIINLVIGDIMGLTGLAEKNKP